MAYMHDFTGSVLTDRYQLEHLLGTGAFASVYFARDRKTYGREVAVKVLHPEHTRNLNYVERFNQEVKVAARVATRYREHLTQIIDQGICEAHDPPLVYFVMEYIDGVSLRSLVLDARGATRVQRPLAWQRAVALAQQLCRAIAPLHAHGVIHRDIKPENCLIERRSDRECIKLLDLGIAKIVPTTMLAGDGPTTEARMVLGTPRYMAPEQMSGLDVDHRVDIYAVGVILYEFLTGVMPRRLDFADVEAGLIPPEPRPPSQVAPNANIPVTLDAVVLQAIAWRREDRFVRADAFAAALEDASRTSPGRTRGVTSRITQPFLPRMQTRRVVGTAACNPPAASTVLDLAAPAVRPTMRRWTFVRASSTLNGVLAGAGSVSSILFGLAMLATVRTAETRPLSGPFLEDMDVQIPSVERVQLAEHVRSMTPPSVDTRLKEDSVVATIELPRAEARPADPHEGRGVTPPQPETPPAAPTTRSLVKRFESKARSRCRSPGEIRIVDFVMKFAPGSTSARSAKVVGSWSGNQFVEFCDCVERVLLSIDFSTVASLPSELHGSFRL